jgi:hypothetical protein
MLCSPATDSDIKFAFIFVDAGHDYAARIEIRIKQEEGGMSVDAGGDGQMKL